MNQTGGADRPGPAPNAVRETQKRGVVRQALQGLHGPLLLGCGQGLAPQGSSANGGRFRQFMPEGQQALDPSALAAIQPRPGFALAAHAPTTLSLAAERSFRRYCQNVAHRDWPRPHNCHGLKRGYRTSEDLAEVLAARPAKWFLSARDARAPARSGSRRRPLHPPRRWPASAHRDRSLAVRS